MNLAEWAEQNGIARITAYRWFRDGKLPVPARKVGGLILVDEHEQSTPTPTRTVVYARVSSSDQKSNLDGQVSRIVQWCTKQNMTVDEVVTEVGSALNGNRRKFKRLLSDASATHIVVEHRDRSMRFGSEYVEAALSAQGRTLTVIDTTEADDDLVRDMTELLTSICARLYDKRTAANRAKAAIAAAESSGDDDD